MKKLQLFYLILFSFSTFNLFAQIITDNEEGNHKIKTEKTNLDSTKTEILFSLFTAYNDRKLISNDYPFGKPLGERSNEIPIWTTNYSIGFRQYLNKNFAFEGKLSFTKTGEQYKFQSSTSDSTYNYTQKYNFIGMPLTINYYTGNKFKFIIGAGISPQIFMSASQKTSWSNANGESKNETTKTKQGYNYFNLGANVQIGINYRFNKKWSFEILPTYRNLLFSTYLKTSNFKHFNSQLGIQYGLNFKF